MPGESNFRTDLIITLNSMMGDDGYILNMTNSGIQGFPDLFIAYRDRWAALECKIDAGAKEQPNQRHYVEHLNILSFASFIHPGNKEEVLDGLCRALRLRR